MKGENVSKHTKGNICYRRWIHRYNETQIDNMTSKAPRKQCKKWTIDNYISAFNLLCKVDNKGYQYVQKNLLFKP